MVAPEYAAERSKMALAVGWDARLRFSAAEKAWSFE
jgi:predicted transcriptional regulator